MLMRKWKPFNCQNDGWCDEGEDYGVGYGMHDWRVHHPSGDRDKG